MPPSLQPGRCITYEESRGKHVYGVVVELGTDRVLVARGTSNGSHDETQMIRLTPVQPGSREARRWTNPPITRDTYFYSFDIQAIPREVIDGANLHSLCEESLWNDIRNVAQRKSLSFMIVGPQPRQTGSTATETSEPSEPE